MTISPEAYWQQRDSKYRGEWTEEIQKNGAKTIAAVNKLLAYAAKDGIERNEVSSGWRPKGINDATANAAKVSNHLLALACDIKDTDRELAQWCVYNLNKLDECGLWMEDPRYSPTWLHLQTVPPKSGKRIFIPSNNPPKCAELDGQKPLPVRVRI